MSGQFEQKKSLENFLSDLSVEVPQRVVEQPCGEAAEPEVGAEAGGGGEQGLRRHPGAAEGGDPGLD